MTHVLHREYSLDDVLAFNQQLIALSEAGLPFELNFGDDKHSLSQTLAQFNARLTLQLAQGQTLDQILAQEDALPAQYRNALNTWLHGDRPIEALNALNASAEGRRDVEADVGYSLMQPLIVLGLVYAGFVYLVLTTAPKLEAIYVQIAQPKSLSLSILTFARHWLPLWGPAVPLAMLLAIVIWNRRSSHWTFRWVPGRTQVFDALRKANYAESVARLVENNHSLGQALALVGPLVSESISSQVSASATKRVIEAEREQAPLSADDPALSALPSMLRWAFTGNVDGDAKASVLRFVARTYRDSANQQTLGRQNWLPIVCGALLGGLLVLGFSLSLFVPMVELLKTLTLP